MARTGRHQLRQSRTNTLEFRQAPVHVCQLGFCLSLDAGDIAAGRQGQQLADRDTFLRELLRKYGFDNRVDLGDSH